MNFQITACRYADDKWQTLGKTKADIVNLHAVPQGRMPQLTATLQGKYHVCSCQDSVILLAKKRFQVQSESAVKNIGLIVQASDTVTSRPLTIFNATVHAEADVTVFVQEIDRVADRSRDYVIGNLETPLFSESLQRAGFCSDDRRTTFARNLAPAVLTAAQGEFYKKKVLHYFKLLGTKNESESVALEKILSEYASRNLPLKIFRYNVELDFKLSGATNVNILKIAFNKSLEGPTTWTVPTPQTPLKTLEGPKIEEIAVTEETDLPEICGSPQISVEPEVKIHKVKPKKVEPLPIGKPFWEQIGDFFKKILHILGTPFRWIANLFRKESILN